MLNINKLRINTIAILLLAGLTLAASGMAETSPGGGATNSLITGIVVEILDADGYTYVCIENNGQMNWAATRGAPVEIGDEVEIASGSMMETDFESAILGRTFDTLIFTNAIVRR